MQRIAVFGGTGMTGQCVVDYALQKGLHVRLLYRSETTLPVRFKGRVELVQGNVLNINDCKRTLESVDGVCVILGTRNKLEATTEMSTGTANIIAAMKELEVRRISIVMSSFLFREKYEVPEMFHNLNDEHRRMLESIKASGLEFVAVLPPHIADEPGSEFDVMHDEVPGRMISKYDLANFIVDCLQQEEHIGKVCGVAKKLDK